MNNVVILLMGKSSLEPEDKHLLSFQTLIDYDIYDLLRYYTKLIIQCPRNPKENTQKELKDTHVSQFHISCNCAMH